MQRFLHDPIKLGRRRRTNREEGGVRCHFGGNTAILPGVRGKRFQSHFQISNSISTLEAACGMSREPGCFISQSDDRRSLPGLRRAFGAQFLLQQFRAQSNTHQLLPNTVVQIVSNPPLFAAATLDHLTLQPGALDDFLLQRCSLLLP